MNKLVIKKMWWAGDTPQDDSDVGGELVLGCNCLGYRYKLGGFRTDTTVERTKLAGETLLHAKATQAHKTNLAAGRCKEHTVVSQPAPRPLECSSVLQHFTTHTGSEAIAN